MRLSCRRKILLDPEMNLQFTIFKPAATARGKFGWFHRLWNSEDALIEFPGVSLPPGWHGEQDMIQSANAHGFRSRTGAAARLSVAFATGVSGEKPPRRRRR